MCLTLAASRESLMAKAQLGVHGRCGNCTDMGTFSIKLMCPCQSRSLGYTKKETENEAQTIHIWLQVKGIEVNLIRLV